MKTTIHRKKYLWAAFFLVVVVLLLTNCTGPFMSWKTVSNDFMQIDSTTSYGPGDFRIHGGQMVSMKLASPKITFKDPTEEELNSPDYNPEVTEPWMDDVAERRNRRSVTVYAGTIDAPEKTFFAYAQHAAWWVSPDFNVIYLATTWGDAHLKPEAKETKLWKSTDGGLNWMQMDWPVKQHISFLHFLDDERGYAIGQGLHIWRTKNGGKSWRSIPVPPNALDPNDPLQRFALVALGADGVLRMAFTPFESTPPIGDIYSLPWGDAAPHYVFSVPARQVNNMVADKNGEVYVLAATGPRYKNSEQTTTLYHWSNEELTKLHSFDVGMAGYGIYFTPEDNLLVQGPDYGSLLPKDWTAISYDQGKSWDIEKDSSAQGGYYDPVTGTDWRVSGYTLSKRTIR